MQMWQIEIFQIYLELIKTYWPHHLQKLLLHSSVVFFPLFFQRTFWSASNEEEEISWLSSYFLFRCFNTTHVILLKQEVIIINTITL